MTEDLLRHRMARLGAGPPTANWDEVRARGVGLRKRRRGTFVGIAAAAALAVVVTPAFGLGAAVIDFFQAEPAPEVLKRHFAEFDRGAPSGMEPGVVASEARAVIRRDLSAGRFTLWVAPTRQGGYCLALGRDAHGFAASCDRLGELRLAPAGTKRGPGTPWLQFGAVKAADATRVEIELDDGTSVDTELVWVSEPIDAGFFVTELPFGREAIAFVARDHHGNELARLLRPHGWRP
jgi:hypothetical protein